MITEKEFRMKCFEVFSKTIQNKRIALYGTGVNAERIIQSFPELQIVGVVEKEISCDYIYGKKNLRLEELIPLKIDTIIIASTIAPIKEIYNRICSFCNCNRIDIYDMYGNNLNELFYKLLDNQTSLCDRNVDTLKDIVADYDVVSIDLEETLLNCKKPIKEMLWWETADACKGIVCNAFAFVDARKKAAQVAAEQNCGNKLNVIYDEVQKTLGLTDEQAKILMMQEKKCFQNSVSIDNKLVDILSHAKSLNKEVVIISDTYLTEAEIVKLLGELDFQAYDVVLSAEDRKCTKISGLYRTHNASGKKWLHIGQNEISDGVVPLIYGMDICMLYANKQISKNSPYYGIYEKILTWYREGKVQEVIKYGGSSLMSVIQKAEMSDHFAICNDGCNQKKDIPDLPQLLFPKYENPKVSIVIPVYNQFLFTYNCLAGILKNTANVSYEVIIADDCSTDATRQIEKVAKGIRVLHNEQNLRFLKNCNNAAKEATGQYILFLNNDTYVQPQWLSKLVTLIESENDIGMVGSKLVYPDGRLQEAGGILWEDGSAWNFGYGLNPQAPIYNYVKDVDYISGAAIMIKSALWKKIGGFDERFAPAYYEDTDLAFEVRKQGYRVVYHPFSVVAHYEGISNGTDVNTGLKAYQVENGKKFYKKWKNVLQRDHFKNGTELYLAKDRGQFKKHILVVDHYVPQYDHDAGGRCTYMYLKAFLKLGMKVTFIGDNFAYSTPYSQELLEMGVEILYGSYYKLHLEEWMEQNLKYFDFVYLQRPHISIKYIDLVKKYGHAKIFYFAHDLHHVRLNRQYELTGDVEVLREAKKWKKVEMELFKKANVGHVVGSFEQQYMQEIYPQKAIRNIPLYIFEQLYTNNRKNFAERKDILYVGGFGHPPNVDAVLWFAKEVFPQIVANYPEIKWHIVGNKPTEEIKELASDNIIIEGFVSDEVLEQFYNNCRLAVVPLRVGAGVKGKVIEAAYYQLPLVTTDVGAEGISAEEGALVVENCADDMARRIISLYEDYNELERLAACEKQLIENHYMIDSAMDVLEMDMQILH